jgi:hypothetical protein
MGTCCYYYQFNPAISERKAYQIQLALEDMVDIHSEELPPPYPIVIPRTIRTCICSEPACICPINYIELVHHILDATQHRMYATKGSRGFQYASERLSYLLYLAQQ